MSQLLIRGLPWKATKAHVSLFLLSHGLDAREDSIEMLNTKCMPNGRAIVYCDSNPYSDEGSKCNTSEQIFRHGISKFMCTQTSTKYLR